MAEKEHVKSSDWLIKGYSQEELARMKSEAINEANAELRAMRIKEIAELLWHFPKALHLNCYNDCEVAAELLCQEGNRKQISFVSEIFTELDRMLSSYSSTHYTISVEEYEAFKNKYIKYLRTMTPEERERHLNGNW